MPKCDCPMLPVKSIPTECMSIPALTLGTNKIHTIENSLSKWVLLGLLSSISNSFDFNAFSLMVEYGDSFFIESSEQYDKSFWYPVFSTLQQQIDTKTVWAFF